MQRQKAALALCPSAGLPLFDLASQTCQRINTRIIALQVRILSESGIREVTLLGQNVNSYADASLASSQQPPVWGASPGAEPFAVYAQVGCSLHCLFCARSPCTALVTSTHGEACPAWQALLERAGMPMPPAHPWREGACLPCCAPPLRAAHQSRGLLQRSQASDLCTGLQGFHRVFTQGYMQCAFSAHVLPKPQLCLSACRASAACTSPSARAACSLQSCWMLWRRSILRCASDSRLPTPRTSQTMSCR